MKQKIGSMKSVTEPVTDLDVFFLAVYNLIYEKIETEPNKGIIVNKGQETQRKAKWAEIMAIAHIVEDFFIFREMRVGEDICGTCKYWRSTSEDSPHMGKCIKNKTEPIHVLNTCKRFDRRLSDV